MKSLLPSVTQITKRFYSAGPSVFKQSINEASNKSVAVKEPVPDVMVTFGNPPNHMTFLSHPGVMAVCKLLELKYLVTPRACLTQENVDAIREFDAALADKCQLAVDADIHINFMDIEHLDKPELLQQYLHEKELLSLSRKEVLCSPPGVYRIPYYAREWEKPEVPRKWRPETAITPDILAVEPDLIKDIELQSIVSEYLRTKPVDEDYTEDPIVRAAEESKKEGVRGSEKIKKKTKDTKKVEDTKKAEVTKKAEDTKKPEDTQKEI